MTKILVVAEVKNGEIKKSTLELLSFSKSKGLQTDAVLCGSEISSLSDILGGQGASTIYLGDDSSLEIFNTEQYTSKLERAFKKVYLNYKNRVSPSDIELKKNE